MGRAGEGDTPRALPLSVQGEAAISPCPASRTQMLDLASGEWARDLLAACGIEIERLAPPAPADGGVVGTMRPKLAKALGLEGEVLLGSGVIAPGQAMVSTGTAEVVEVAMAAPALDAALREGGISVYRHVVPGLWAAWATGPSLGGGEAVNV